ncbi:helix-turn-helix transcriptional regulator [Rhodococcus opacus]|uniref:helix-turn-helix transcriptional regulator n=1 Tax=Rhodococcus opacus TaxID=37919 RepID=UPI00295483EE|nr:AAA family ATPase [Rhodococcus opacus]MDV7089159.1 AAA family ATPase [Rhodococcus opacus]
MSNNEPGLHLRGRRSECAALDRLVAGVQTGESQVLVLRGETGVGKTAMLEYLAARAEGCRVARTAGVESEMELAFAGLQQLCAPLLDHLDHLPAPQRGALAVALGLSSGDPPDRFLVGLAVLNLLAEAAEKQPIVCLVDDAQWLDRISAQTFVFVARRLLAERVALVFAVRGTRDDRAFMGLQELTIQGLRDDDARALLDSAIPGRLDEHVRDRIIAETHGNPLALLELPRGLTAAELAGGFSSPDAQPLSSQIEQSFLRRVKSLPAQTQQLLLTAAAEPVGDVPLLRRAAARLGIGAEAATPAEAAGLIELGVRVRFHHPLVRSAAYRAAGLGDRQAVHRALAEATDPESDPDRRAWHRAHAAIGPDEAVASELERSANRAQGRGGVAAAAAFLERATALTPDPARRGRRAFAAAQAKFEAAAPDAAYDLLATAELSPLNDLQRARLARLRARMAFTRRRGSDATPLLLDAAKQLEGLDDELAHETYLEALGAAIFASRLGGERGVREAAQAALAAPPGPLPARPLDLLLNGLATRFTEGYRAGAPILRRGLKAFRQEVLPTDDDIRRWLWLACPIAQSVAHELWDDEAWHELATRAVQLARDTGALGVLPVALIYRASVHLHAGEFASASALIEEADALTEANGYARVKYTSLVLAAWRGDDTQAVKMIEAGVENATARGEGRIIGMAGYVTAVLYNGRGRYPDALDGARRACEHDDLGFFGWSLVELVEAAVRSGAHEAAVDTLRRLEERTLPSGSDWALGILARSRALLSSGKAADSLFRESIERLERTRIVVHLARAHLVYGEWLRRENRRIDARKHLRIAHEMLSHMGAEAFTERARRELLATGETVRSRTFEARDALTAQETQIARLAGDGLTNPEIGAQLFISPHTVEWHLRKVFAKLGIRSRKQIRGTLPNDAEQAVGGDPPDS